MPKTDTLFPIKERFPEIYEEYYTCNICGKEYWVDEYESYKKCCKS